MPFKRALFASVLVTILIAGGWALAVPQPVRHVDAAAGPTLILSAPGTEEPSALGIFFDGTPGTGAPPATLGGYAMTPFGADSRALNTTVPNVPVPVPPGTANEVVTFSFPLSHLRIGSGWATWSHGYQGDVYSTNGALSVALTMPPGTRAFYLYAEGNSFSSYNFTVTDSSGTTSGPIAVSGNAGAKYFGFYATGDTNISVLTISAESGTGGFSIGEFGIAKGGRCTINCSVVVPQAGNKDVPVAFQSNVSSVTCEGPTTYSWVFGDGSTSSVQNPSKTYTSAGQFTWTFTGKVGEGSCERSGTITISSTQKPVILTFSANPAVVLAGGTSELKWTSTGGNSAKLEPGGFNVPVNGSRTVTVNETTTFTLTVTGPGGSVTAQTLVTVLKPPVIKKFEAAPTTIFSGQISTLSWEVTDATSVKIDPGALTVPFAGSLNVGPLTQTTEYTLTATGPGGTTTAKAAVTVNPWPASFLFISGAVSWVVAPGGALASADVWVRNVGNQQGSIDFTFEGNIPGSVNINPAALVVGAGQDAMTKLSLPASVLGQPGSYSGVLTGKYAGGEITLPVSLTVMAQPLDPDTQSKIKVRAENPSLYFTAPDGSNPVMQTLRLFVEGLVPGKVAFVQGKVASGSWIQLAGPFSSPVPADGIVDVTVSIDRSKRTAQDGISPFVGYLSFGPAGEDLNNFAVSTLVRVTDSIPLPVKAAAGPERVGATQSFIIPSVVFSPGSTAGSQFSTDGWVSNLGTNPAVIQLYFTPAGKDGISDTGVLQATATIPAETTWSLANLLQSVYQFRVEDRMYGALQIISSADDDLVVRVVTNVNTTGDPTLSFRDQLPPTALGLGTILGGPSLFIAGISQNALWRTNILLVETTGNRTFAQVAIRDKDGKPVGAPAPVEVPPYGLVQLPVSSISGTTEFENGSAEITVISGSGRIAAYATVISTKNYSFTTIPAGAAAPPTANRKSKEPGLAAGPVGKVIVPAMARIPGFNVTFQTSFKMVNSQDATRTIELQLYRQDGTPFPPKTVTLAPKATYSREDFLKEEFGLDNFVGRLEVGGDVTAVWRGGNATLLSTPVSAAGTEPATKIATIPTVYMADEATSKDYSAGAKRYVAGLERSSTRRNSLILVETAGQGCDVLVQVYNKEGQPLRTEAARINVPANFYRQVNDFVVSQDGLQLESLRNAVIADHRVETIVPGDAACRVIPLVTHVDNNSGQSEISDSKKPGSKNIK